MANVLKEYCTERVNLIEGSKEMCSPFVPMTVVKIVTPNRYWKEFSLPLLSQRHKQQCFKAYSDLFSSELIHLLDFVFLSTQRR